MTKARKAPTPDARRDLQKELAAAGALKHQLGEAFEDDHDLQLLRDMIEGETDLDAAIDAVLAQMALDIANVAGIEKFETTLSARKKRLKDRYDAMQTMLLNALDIVELPRAERPLALIYTRPKPFKVVVTDESLIPTKYFRQPDPELSKADLGEALKLHREAMVRLSELSLQRDKGEIDAAAFESASAALMAEFPAVPGAELDNGGTTLVVKWS